MTTKRKVLIAIAVLGGLFTMATILNVILNPENSASNVASGGVPTVEATTQTPVVDAS